jgi:heat shock protein HtpX
MLENLCISRGIPMPRFEVIDSPALNAFASGIDDRSWSITLTRGIVEALPDDELEAVIGHELTHIINRDARLLVIAVIFVGMISFFTQIVFRMLVHGRHPNYYRRDRDQGGGALVLIISLAILAIGYVFALFIRLALSRRREYLADAGSVVLTKNPGAMMRALLRISGKDHVKGMPGQVQQMCIENSQQFLGMFATHPPIEARVQEISRLTGEPVPQALPVTLRRAPKRPWDIAA